jgi:metal-responsive CopG/Arc/MetJ family transcriptional regulator
MSRGRPKLPKGEKMVSISLRLPAELVDWYDTVGAGVLSRSCVMRQALEEYTKEGT